MISVLLKHTKPRTIKWRYMEVGMKKSGEIQKPPKGLTRSAEFKQEQKKAKEAAKGEL